MEKKRIACARKGCRIPANWVFKKGEGKSDLFYGIELGFCTSDHIIEFFTIEFLVKVNWNMWKRSYVKKTRNLNKRLFKKS